MNRLVSFSRLSATTPTPASSSTEDLSGMLFPMELSQSIQAFLNNLANPIHRAPFPPERLTAMFQDFYAGTFEQIYDILPESIMTGHDGQEMLSSEEIDAAKTRRLAIEQKRQDWREEIEARVCLEMYDKIFELRTSTDEARDEALMSKIIAMNLIGVSLEQLGVGMSDEEWVEMQPTIIQVGEELQSLNNALTPKSKVDLLIASHKRIVDEVQQTNIAEELSAAIVDSDKKSISSLSSKSKGNLARRHLGADAILPILIYSIIKSNPAKLVSHFQFIQRFRASSLLTGESSYCLTNLEAAIGFLEAFEDGQGIDPDHLNLGNNTKLRASNSTTSLASSIRASDRARALSSAAQDVYDFADERMKSLGTQFGVQLGALVSKVSQNHDLAEVRTLMNLPAVEVSSTPTLMPQDKLPLSPSKPVSTIQSQPAKAAGSFGRLAGLGMIRNLSNSFSQRAAEPRPATRELDTVIPHVNSADMQVAASGMACAGSENKEPMLRSTKHVSRFMSMDAEDLTIRDVHELLEAYKALAKQFA